MKQVEWRNIAQYHINLTQDYVYSEQWNDFPRCGPLLNYYVEPTLVNARGESLHVADTVLAEQRILFLGSAGSGKTTMLRALTYQLSTAFLDGSGDSCPFLIYARTLCNLDPDTAFLDEVLHAIAVESGIKLDAGSLQAACFEGRVHLLVDGLDEIAPQSRDAVIRQILDWGRRFPAVRIALSSRPAAITHSFREYSTFTIASFSNEQISLLAKRLASSSPERFRIFQRAILDHSHLANLATNPLLIQLLWSVFESHGQIPTNPTFLYSDFTDYLLSSWDQAKGIGPRGKRNLRDRHRLLERLALHLFQGGRIHFDRDDLVTVSKDLYADQFRNELLEDTVQWIESCGLLHRDSEQTYSFVHNSFLEYYTARAVRHDPSEVIRFLDREDAKEIVLFSCGLVDDVAPLVEAAVNRGLIMLAAKCLSNGHTRNRQLSEYVVREFTREIGQPFVDLLVEINAPDVTDKVPEDEIDDILDLWERAAEVDQPSHIKGSRFEDFAEAFFGTTFKVVSRDLNTENGELDLIIELGRMDPYWFEFGGDALIECKNWSSNIPLKEVGSFITKVNQGRVRLAFFVSVSGFTSDAIRTLKNNASNSTAPLVVPISGSEIKEALMRGEVLEQFFKKAIRSVKYLRKY